MKFISLLITVIVIGLIANQQLTSNADSKVAISNDEVSVPRVPTAPEDVQKFKKDMNEYMLNTNKQRDEELNKQLSR